MGTLYIDCKHRNNVKFCVIFRVIQDFHSRKIASNIWYIHLYRCKFHLNTTSITNMVIHDYDINSTLDSTHTHTSSNFF